MISDYRTARNTRLKALTLLEKGLFYDLTLLNLEPSFLCKTLRHIANFLENDYRHYQAALESEREVADMNNIPYEVGKKMIKEALNNGTEETPDHDSEGALHEVSPKRSGATVTPR